MTTLENPVRIECDGREFLATIRRSDAYRVQLKWTTMDGSVESITVPRSDVEQAQAKNMAVVI